MIIGILGPTASGKTALSTELAEEFGGEIVSADSVAVYKGFDIGSAKPTKEEREKAVFHLIDFLDPNMPFSVGDFQRMSHKIIDDILRRGKLPIVSGGSGLYAKVAFEGLDSVPSPSPETRAKVNALISENYAFAVEKIKFIDPALAEKTDLKNPRRLARLLEIYEETGKSPSLVFQNCKAPKRPEYRAFCLTMEREKLIERINRRVDLMAEQGLFEEVARLLENGADKNSQPMMSIGYKECVLYFDGKLSKDEALERIKISTRRFAKRQYTWFRKYSSVIWVTPDSISEIKNYIKGLKL